MSKTLKLEDADLEYLVNGAHGVYVPKIFWEAYYKYFPDRNKKQTDADLSNPTNEHYWDTWSEILDSTIINDNGEEVCFITIDGDVFAITLEQAILINWDEELP